MATTADVMRTYLDRITSGDFDAGEGTITMGTSHATGTPIVRFEPLDPKRFSGRGCRRGRAEIAKPGPKRRA